MCGRVSVAGPRGDFDVEIALFWPWAVVDGTNVKAAGGWAESHATVQRHGIPAKRLAKPVGRGNIGHVGHQGRGECSQTNAKQEIDTGHL